METKSRDGEFIGSGMRASFLKDKIDLAHCRGYAVLVIRVTSADDPDDKAVYNMYQIDANKGRAVSEMYEALKVAERWCKQRLSDDHVDMEMIHLALAKAEGRDKSIDTL